MGNSLRNLAGVLSFLGVTGCVAGGVGVTMDLALPCDGGGCAADSSEEGVAGCDTGWLACETGCVDPLADPLNCGECLHECGQGQVCSNGSCVVSCRSVIGFSGAAIARCGPMLARARGRRQDALHGGRGPATIAATS